MKNQILALGLAFGFLASSCSKDKDDDATPSGNFGTATVDGATYSFTDESHSQISGLYSLYNWTVKDGKLKGVSVTLETATTTPPTGQYDVDSASIIFQTANPDQSNPQPRYFGKAGEKVTVSKEGNAYRINFSGLTEVDVFGTTLPASSSKLTGNVLSTE